MEFQLAYVPGEGVEFQQIEPRMATFRNAQYQVKGWSFSMLMYTSLKVPPIYLALVAIGEGVELQHAYVPGEGVEFQHASLKVPPIYTSGYSEGWSFSMFMYQVKGWSFSMLMYQVKGWSFSMIMYQVKGWSFRGWSFSMLMYQVKGWSFSMLLYTSLKLPPIYLALVANLFTAQD